MPRTADKTDIPRRLSEAGYALFNQLGYNATGIQQITGKAGVPKGSFYNHFESKEDFAAQIILNYGAWVGKAWDTAMQSAPAAPIDAMRHLFASFIQHHENTGPQGCLVGNFAAEMAESSESCRTVLCSVMMGWRERLAALIAQAQDHHQIRSDIHSLTLSSFFWDAWEGAVLRMKVEHSTQPLKDVVALMLDKFFQP
jgi:TetR/AcrR family transcriptional repressor of nem operon